MRLKNRTRNIEFISRNRFIAAVSGFFSQSAGNRQTHQAGEICGRSDRNDGTTRFHKFFELRNRFGNRYIAHSVAVLGRYVLAAITTALRSAASAALSTAASGRGHRAIYKNDDVIFLRKITGIQGRWIDNCEWEFILL